MPETMQHLLGQLVEGRYPLRKVLGVSQNSVVFLTSVEPARHTEPPPDAAIKLVPEDPESAETQLERWKAAAALSHPGLLRILHAGRCALDGSPCLYLVTELADEDLGQLLPQRGLNPEEARGMLGPVLETLDYLHEHGLVHGGVKPANIHAIGNQVKLSADRILRAGESATAWPVAAPFAPPESVLFPASDVWGLGFTICEALTQKLPVRSASGEFAYPDLPAPFEEIVRSALVDDATMRISLDGVRALVDPAFVARRPAVEPPVPVVPERRAQPEPAVAPGIAAPQAAKASAAAAAASVRTAERVALPQIDPLSVPLSPVEPSGKDISIPAARAPIPVSSLPQVNATIAGATRRIPSPPKPQGSNRLVLVAAAAAVLLAILVVPRLLFRSPRPAEVSSQPVAEQPAKPVAAVPSESPNLGPASGAANSTKAQPKADEPPARPSATAAAKSSVEPPAELNKAATSTRVATAEKTGSDRSAEKPTILRRVLPEVSEKARATISGTVRINVKVQLNPDGTVSAAELANPAASQYFGGLAVKAAQQWQFGARGDEAAPGSAVIRFDFTQTSTAADVIP
jgi:TonB family protein